MTPAGVLHVVFASSDAVHGFLGPATRELASLGQSQSVILLDDAAARGHLPGLQRHARVVLVRGDGEGEGDGRTRHRAFYEACRREIVERRPATLHFHGLASCAIGGSVAGHGPGFGFAPGGARIDKDCNARADAQILYQLGEKEAAVLLLSAHSTAINAAVTEARTRK